MTKPSVSMVIPGRNCAATIAECLTAATTIFKAQDSSLKEILFVDDGSTDNTPEIVTQFPSVTLLPGEGKGPGSARNLGWRAAKHPLIWFVDSDCVAEPDALNLLLPHLGDPRIAAVSGSYGNMRPDSLLARLIHEEIIERHRRMKTEVNFLATFNVLYRKSVLQELNGFDTRYLKGQDAELAFRAAEAGHTLHFELNSQVGHYHETNWRKYLRIQRQQGYWRVWLHFRHSGHAGGDSYSNFTDHIQPPLAMLFLASLILIPLSLLPNIPNWIGMTCMTASSGLLLLLGLTQLPMTLSLIRRVKNLSYLLFVPMSMIRAFWRGIGMTGGTLNYLTQRNRSKID